MFILTGIFVQHRYYNFKVSRELGRGVNDIKGFLAKDSKVSDALELICSMSEFWAFRLRILHI